MSLTQTPPFGVLLKQLRKRAGMTQRDLGAALGYGDALISSLERSQRLPDLDAVVQRFIPALGLQEDSRLAAILVEAAALARGQTLPTATMAALRSEATGKFVNVSTSYSLPSCPLHSSVAKNSSASSPIDCAAIRGAY